MSRNNLTRADDLFIGKAQYNRAFSAKQGIPYSALYFHNYGAITTLDADGVAAAQQAAGAGNLTINGALAASGVATFDVARAVSIASAGNLSGVTFTITGTDHYGAALTQALAGPNNGTVVTTKAFKTVTQVAVSGAVGTDVTVGDSDVIGLPFRSDAGELCLVFLNGVSVDAATLVRAVTAAASGTTGDVRGTFNPSAAINGSNIFGVLMQPHSRQDKEGAYGVAQA